MTFVYLLFHPHVLITETLSPAHSDAMVRWRVWTAYMAILSGILPLVIGAGMRLFSFRPDADAKPRKTRQRIVSERAANRVQFLGVQFRRADAVHELELPSPEPEPFTTPERGGRAS
jgi:hypothetical protein